VAATARVLLRRTTAATKILLLRRTAAATEILLLRRTAATTEILLLRGTAAAAEVGGGVATATKIRVGTRLAAHVGRGMRSTRTRIGVEAAATGPAGTEVVVGDRGSAAIRASAVHGALAILRTNVTRGRGGSTAIFGP